MKRMDRDGSPKERLLKITALLFFCVFAAWVYFHKPGESQLLPKCIFYQVTHLYCPSCGFTRALYCVLHGDFWTAFRCNAMIFPLILAALCIELRPRLAAKNHVVVPILVLILIWWLIRNIPLYPFTLLIPPVL